MDRKPKTTQERRENGKRDLLEIDGYRIKLRAKRNQANLIEAWDDVCRKDWRNRTWKRHRRSQYKVKPVD